MMVRLMVRRARTTRPPGRNPDVEETPLNDTYPVDRLEPMLLKPDRMGRNTKQSA